MLNYPHNYSINNKYGNQIEKGVFMKGFLQKLSTSVDESFLGQFKEKFLGFINKHPEIFCLSLLAIMCLIFLFFGLNFYPLLDVDETRYAIMSRDLLNSFDWNSLMLNSQPFLEKPPLYFWLVAASIKTMGEFTAYAVRLPIAILASFITFFTYFVGKRVISRKFGMISALILLSSIFFLILSHVAIIDMVLTVFMTSAIYSAFMTHFCSEKYKKYLWWYFYLFAGLAFLAKGLLGIAIPALIIFLYNLSVGKAKEIFKPINMLPGLVVFLALILPWHIMMYMEYGNQFIREYFLYHHFARFLNSAHIGRERPLLYFIPVFLLGFLPWSFIFIAAIVDGFKKLFAKYKAAEGTIKTKFLALLDAPTNEQKLILFATIYFVVVFAVFSSSSTKLPTYILPVFPAAALLTGYFWWVSDEKSQNERVISATTQLFAILFIITAISGTVAYFVLPFDLQYQFSKFRSDAVCGLYLISILLLLRINSKRALSVFSAYILSMMFIIVLGVSYIFNVVYQGGENEIVRYSNIAQDGVSQLVTFDFAVKPSAMIGYTGKVQFVTDPDFKLLDEALQYKYGPTFVIIKNKNLSDANYKKEIDKRLELSQMGKRYSLFVKDPTGYYKKHCEVLGNCFPKRRMNGPNMRYVEARQSYEHAKKLHKKMDAAEIQKH